MAAPLFFMVSGVVHAYSRRCCVEVLRGWTSICQRTSRLDDMGISHCSVVHNGDYQLIVSVRGNCHFCRSQFASLPAASCTRTHLLKTATANIFEVAHLLLREAASNIGVLAQIC